MNKNVDKSKKLKKTIRSKSQQCFANAWDAIETLEEYKNATYVEGLAVLEGIMVIEHGWIEHEGEIIDPTLLEETMVYFPGLRFKGRDGLDSTWRIPGWRESGDKLPIFYRYGWGGINSPEFLQAKVDAYRFAGNNPAADACISHAKRNVIELLKAG